jgi:hypothetical protein
MSASTPLRKFGMNIKRGRSLPTAGGAANFLRVSDSISPLLPTIKRNASLQKDCRKILPLMFDTCEILQLSEGQLTLAVPNAAVASKLKQQCPKLQDALQQLGWQINVIRIKVQVRKVVEKAPPVKQAILPSNAVNAFESLQSSLEDTPQNAALRAALAQLVRRRKG